MAVKSTSTLLFMMRLAGLTGLMLLIVGLVLWLGVGVMSAGIVVTLIGAGLLVLAGIVELKGLMGAVMSQRGAMGTNVALQFVLAVALLAGVNYYSFGHYLRFDWTSDNLFTINSKLRSQLEQLRAETKIVVYLRYTSSLGQGVDNKLAHFQAAAQRQIVEKVKDLADQFRELGPRFQVQVLNIQDEDFDSKLRDIKKESTVLADAIETAPENSIFFLSSGQVQRLGFNDIYQLDSEASLAANENKGNLILNYQGEAPFANNILKIEEKTPPIAVAVVHPALSMAYRDNPILTMAGAKKTLESHGFACQDLLLRKIDPDGRLMEEPAALTYDENRFEQIEDTLVLMDEDLQDGNAEFAKMKGSLDTWTKQTLAELQKSWIYVQLPNGQQGVIPREALSELEKKKVQFKTVPIDEEDRTNQIMAYTRNVKFLESELTSMQKERTDLLKEKEGLKVENLAEKRRIKDVEAKMNRMLTDIDLLIIPRFTFYHLPSKSLISNRVHKLDPAQLRSIRTFIKEGKPVLFLLGPRNEERETPPGLGPDGDDGLEPMLAELGIYLPNQTVLYNAEIKEFTEHRTGADLTGRRELELPPLLVNWEPNEGQVAQKIKDKRTKSNPIRTSLLLAKKSMGKKEMEDLQARHSRPVYFLKDPANKSEFDNQAVFLMTSELTWNENYPFIKEPDDRSEKKEVPHFRPTPVSDPKKGTLEEERQGPFPIAAAGEVTLPASWFDDKGGPHKTRLAVVGNGNVFVGQNLAPIKEKLLLDTCNWLLGRPDLLAKDNKVWEYPRVSMSDTAQDLWFWGTFLGMPLLFVYIGILVFMIRRMR